jgi:hypothetical protein
LNILFTAILFSLFSGNLRHDLCGGDQRLRVVN